MRLPNDAQCAAIMQEILDDPHDFTDWEREFAAFNAKRQGFTDAQKQSIARMVEKYDFDVMKGYPK